MKNLPTEPRIDQPSRPALNVPSARHAARAAPPTLTSIYPLPRFRVSLVRENRAAYPSQPIQSSTDAARPLTPYFNGLDREHFIVCGLDAKHRIIDLNTVAISSLSMAIVHPREVFKPLILKNASAWICAHNHPSGDSTPSAEDRTLTTRLRRHDAR